MKFKVVVGVVSVLLLALMVFGSGCGDKTTGGGWFYDCCRDAKVTFGFTAIPTDCDGVKGQFQLVDHSTKPPTKIHGVFTDGYIEIGDYMSGFGGQCRVDGVAPVDFYVLFIDSGEGVNMIGAGDKIAVYIDGVELYAGVLGGGNIQIHD